MDFSDYLLYDAYSNHVTAAESFRNLQHFQNPLAADSGQWNQNERVLMSHSSLDKRDNIPKTAW
jgi:hypothetical protein